MFSANPQKALATPCIGVCRLDPNGYCEGCHRSGDEIARWISYSDAQRRYLIDVVLPQRAATAGST